MDLSNYKAFLFDVDKTLTDTHKLISKRTTTALGELSKQYLVGACSGRHFATVGPVLASLFPSDTLHVLAGGALVIRTNGTIEKEWLIEEKVTKSIVQLAQKYDARIVLQAGLSMYGNEKAIVQSARYGFPNQPPAVARPLSEVENWNVPIIVASELQDAFVEELRLLPINYKLMQNYDGKNYTDITAKSVNKAKGLMEWCRIQDIEPQEIIGFGDSENDIEFLQAVGYAVAMGNAVDAVKQVANEVTLHCDEDGVAVWIEKVLGF